MQGSCETGETGETLDIILAWYLCFFVQNWKCRTSTTELRFLLGIRHCHSLPPACKERRAETHSLGSQQFEWRKGWSVLVHLACRPLFFFHEYGRRVGMVPRSSLKEGKKRQMVEKGTKTPKTNPTPNTQARRPTPPSCSLPYTQGETCETETSDN